MAWQKLNFKLTGEAPLICHNGQTADPLNGYAKAIKAISGKKTKTESDYEEMAKLEFMAGLYLGKEDGPILTAMMVDACVIKGAMKSKDGIAAKSGFFSISDARLEYDGPRTGDELWKLPEFRLSVPVRVGQARIIRTRPIFNEWSAVIPVQYEDGVVNPATVASWFTVAGSLVGLGDWRPRFGRFQAKRL